MSETVWLHVGCGGPVCFTLAGGWCQECGAGPLHPYRGDRYAHRDDQADGATNTKG